MRLKNNIKKAEFDSKLEEYLKWCDVASTEISATLSVPRILDLKLLCQ